MFAQAPLSEKVAHQMEMLEISNNRLHQHIVNAMLLAKEFIVERNLIITGGMALDCMLRLQGFKLYDENTINGSVPDYDVYSPNPVKDSYDFVERLFKLGYDNGGEYTLDSIRGIHIQTMRVRLEFVSILELSYVPPDIFEKMPTLKYEKMRIISPIWQRINMHRSLAYPLIDPPREVLFNRLSKDTERFAILDEYYPVTVKTDAVAKHKVAITPLLTLIERPLVSIKFESSMRVSALNAPSMHRMSNISATFEAIPETKAGDFNNNNVLYGFAAYAAIYLQYKRMSTKFNKSYDSKHIISAEFDVSSTGEITFTSPVEQVDYITTSKTTIKALDEMPEWELYEPLLDYLLPKYHRDVDGVDYNIYCLMNTYINVHKMTVGKKRIVVPCASLLFVYFLTLYNITKNEMYLSYYKSLAVMLGNVNRYMREALERESIDPTTIKLGTKHSGAVSMVIGIILDSSFFIPKYYYGSNNRSESYIINDINEFNLIRRLQKIQEVKHDVLNIPMFKYNPATSVRPGPFNYDEAPFFKLRGVKSDPTITPE